MESVIFTKPQNYLLEKSTKMGKKDVRFAQFSLKLLKINAPAVVPALEQSQELENM